MLFSVYLSSSFNLCRSSPPFSYRFMLLWSYFRLIPWWRHPVSLNLILFLRLISPFSHSIGVELHANRWCTDVPYAFNPTTASTVSSSGRCFALLWVICLSFYQCFLPPLPVLYHIACFFFVLVVIMVLTLLHPHSINMYLLLHQIFPIACEWLISVCPDIFNCTLHMSHPPQQVRASASWSLLRC